MFPLKRMYIYSKTKALDFLYLFYTHLLCSSPQPLSPEKTSASAGNSLTDAERMRQARNQEARELIGSRVGAAKAMFTKHTSEGQLQSKYVWK